MEEYIVTLTRNIGIGKDIVNYFKNREVNVIFEDGEILPKTLIVSTEHDIRYLQNLKYVFNAVESREERKESEFYEMWTVQCKINRWKYFLLISIRGNVSRMSYWKGRKF